MIKSATQGLLSFVFLQNAKHFYLLTLVFGGLSSILDHIESCDKKILDRISWWIYYCLNLLDYGGSHVLIQILEKSGQAQQVNKVEFGQRLERYSELKGRSKIIKRVLKEMNYERRHYYMQNCGSYLKFNLYADEYRSLIHAFFCKDMFCPFCQARKAFLVVKDLNREVDFLSEQGFNFLSLTLTLKSSFDAFAMRSKLWASWRKLSRRSWFSRLFPGSFCSLEWTFNEQEGFHPHLHILLAVIPEVIDFNNFELFRNNYFLLHKKIQEEWYEITGDSYILDVSDVKNLYQYSKYILKGSSIGENYLKELIKVMRGKKSQSRSGVFRNVRLGDDLTHEELLAEVNVEESKYSASKEHGEPIAVEHWGFDEKTGKYKLLFVEDLTKNKKGSAGDVISLRKDCDT